MKKLLLKAFMYLIVAASTIAFIPAASVFAAVPAAPTNLIGVSISGGQVDLYWTDNATDETGFQVWRAPDIGGLGAGTYAQIGTAPATPAPVTTKQFSDMTVAPLTAYWYKVVAVNASGSSFPSNETRILTSASAPGIALTSPTGAVLNSGQANTITANTTVSGANVTVAQYQFVADNAPGVFDAKDIYSTQMTLTIPATLAASPTANTTAMPSNLPAGCIAEFEIRGRVQSIGANGVWTIGSSSPFIVYESATTAFVGSRKPIVGDEVKITAYRTAPANGPLVAKTIRYWAPAAPAAAPSLILSFLLNGTVTAQNPPVAGPGYVVAGEIWTAGTGKFRIDAPYFPAYIDANVAIGTAVTVRFATMPAPANIARQITKQIPTSTQPTTDLTPVFDYTPIPQNLPAGTWLYVIVDGVVSNVDLVHGTWTVGEEGIKCYQTAATFLAPASVGDEVLFFCKRSLTPGPLIIDSTYMILPGPLIRPYKGTAVEMHLMYNGSIQTMGPNNWTIAGPAGSAVSFVVDDPEGVARIDPSPSPVFSIGTPVTVEFEHVGEVIPYTSNWGYNLAPPGPVGPASDPNWSVVMTEAPANTWTASFTPPTVSVNMPGRLFIRAIDATQQSITNSFPMTLRTPPVAPGAPTVTSVTQTAATTVTVGWNVGTTGDPPVTFTVERATGVGTPGAFTTLGAPVNYVAGTTAYSVADSSVTAGTTYWYRVKAVNTIGTSAPSNQMSVAVTNTQPAPTNLSVAMPDTTHIVLTWTDNSTNETGFLVQRSAAVTGPFATLAGGTLAANVVTYTDTITAGAVWYYQVIATGTPANSAPSNMAGNTPPAAPGNVTAAMTASILVTWTDMSSSETGFMVERATAATGPWTQLDADPVAAGVQNAAANSTSFVDSTVTAPNTYWYRVTATGGLLGNSAPMATATGLLYSIPAAPTTLAVAAPTYNQVRVTWADVATNESGYKVQRSTDNFATVTTDLTPTALAANSTSFTDNTVAASTTYQYRVFATNILGNSAMLGPMPVTTPGAPSGGGFGGGGSFGASLIGINLAGTAPYMDANGKSLTAGSISTADGKLTLNIPVGVSIWNAAGAAQPFLSAGTPSPIPTAPAQGKVIAAYEMGTTGVTFNPGISMTFSYTAADIAGMSESSLYVAWWNGTAWEKLNSTVNTTAKTVTATVTHFTTFALIGLQAPATTPPPTTTTPPVTTTTPPVTTTTPPVTTTTPPVTTTYTPPTTTTNPSGTSTNWLLIGGIVAVAIILGLIILMSTKKKA